jgi:hypothetical protein
MDLSDDLIYRVRKFIEEKLRQQINRTIVLTNDVEDILRETRFYEKIKEKE